MRNASILSAVIAISSIAAPAAAGPSAFEELISTFELRGTLGLSAGVDSNPGEAADPEAEGSAFGRVDGEIHIRVGEDGATRAFVDIEGAAVNYADGTFDEEHRYEVDVELRQPLGESLEISLGAERDKDATDDPPTTSDEIWGQVAADTPLVKSEVRGTISEYREDIDPAEIAADDLEVFDERTYSAELHAELNTGSILKPVVKARVSAIDYLERRPGKPERDATEYSAVAAIAVQVEDNLTVQLGLRRNERFFEAEGIGSYSSIGPDVEIEWEPNDRASVQLWLNRGFEEPSLEDGFIRDVRSAGADWTYRVTDRLRLKGGASAAEKREIGTDYHKTDLEGYAEGRFALREGVDLLLGAYIDHEIRHDDPDGDFTRSALRTGLEASF